MNTYWVNVEDALPSSRYKVVLRAKTFEGFCAYAIGTWEDGEFVMDHMNCKHQDSKVVFKPIKRSLGRGYKMNWHWIPLNTFLEALELSKEHGTLKNKGLGKRGFI